MKLTLSNFQIHKDPVTTEIPEGKTTYLEGDSDTGKSSRLRAIRWLCENKPDGGSFVTFKTPRGTTSVVRLEVDGRMITRERGKSKNLYKLDDEVFEAFGRSVPEPIAKVLNLSPYAFQLQGEAPFLIGSSPTESAKILTEACGLGMIDVAVSFVRKRKAIADADIRNCEILLDSARKKLQRAESLLPLADVLERGATLDDETETISNRIEFIYDTIENEPQGEPLDIEPLQAHVSTLRICASEIKESLGRIAKIRSVIEAMPVGEEYDISQVGPVFAIAKEMKEAIQEIETKTRPMRTLVSSEPKEQEIDISSAQIATRGLRSLQKEIEILKEMTNTLYTAINEFPHGEEIDIAELLKQKGQIKVCPTCGREL